MMTDEKRIEWLLELQNHSEQLTDEQLQQILADDEMHRLVEQLGFAKRAFKHNELTNEREQSDACIDSAERGGRRRSQLINDTPDVDAEWEKFATCHAEQLDALDEEKPKWHSSFFTLHSSFQKIAAFFIGVLLASGIAYAAIQIVRNINTSKPQPPTTEQTTDIEPVTSLPADTIKADTITSESYVFNNVPLDSMLAAIAAAHGVDVEFENEAARGLRFHFVWKREDSLARVVEKLNTFEAVNIGMEDKKLLVR